jgi:hypothetical protein
MKGTFHTYVYPTRADYEAGRLWRHWTFTNDFTNVGYEWMWRRMSGLESDDLSRATIVVGDGGGVFTGGEMQLQGAQQAARSLDEGYPKIAGPKITFQATFGERDGAFDWMERGIVTPGGVLLDRAVGDSGRKVFGAVWVVQAELELGRS